MQLDARSKEFGDPEKFSGSTATTASTAFSHSAKKMNDRADQMHDGSEAFRRAANAVHTASGPATGSPGTPGPASAQPADSLTSRHRRTGRRTATSSGTTTARARRPRATWSRRSRKPHPAGRRLREDPWRDPAPAASAAVRPDPDAHGTPTTTTHVPVGTPVDTDHDDPPTNHPDDPPVHIPTPGNPQPPTDPGIPISHPPSDPRIPPGPRRPVPDAVPRRLGAARHARRRWRRRWRRRRRWCRCGRRWCARRCRRGRAGQRHGRRTQRPDAGGRRRHPRRTLGQWRAWHRLDLTHGCRLGPRPWHGRLGPIGRRGPRGCRRRGRPQRRPRRRQGCRRPRVARPGGRARCRCRGRCRPRRQGQKKGRGEERDLFDDGADWIDDEDAAPGLLD